MKRFVFLVMMIAATMFSVAVTPCEAKDIWVDHWQNINADIYVMDETLAWEENLDGKFIKVSAKAVQIIIAQMVTSSNVQISLFMTSTPIFPGHYSTDHSHCKQSQPPANPRAAALPCHFLFFLHIGQVPAAIGLIVSAAFNPTAALGGAAGYGIMTAIRIMPLEIT